MEFRMAPSDTNPAYSTALSKAFEDSPGEFDQEAFNSAMADAERKEQEEKEAAKTKEDSSVKLDLRKAPVGFTRITLYEGQFDAGPSFGTVDIMALSEDGWSSLMAANSENKTPGAVAKLLREMVVSWRLKYPRGPQKGQPVPSCERLADAELEALTKLFPARFWQDLIRAAIFLSIPEDAEISG